MEPGAGAPSPDERRDASVVLSDGPPRTSQPGTRAVLPALRELVAHVRALDRVIHEPARLAIVWHLAQNPTLSFRDLRVRTGLTSGNLSAQTRRLEAAGYLEVLKSFRGRYPATSYRLTSAGLAAWETYQRHLHALRASLPVTEPEAEERP